MNIPLISVVVPVYKVEDYLDECITSLINQTYNNLEIILVDDGSPDKCPEMCDRWAKKDSRIRVIHKENGGLSSARNVGIDNAKGEFLSFVDSDDFFDSKMYEKLYEGVMRSPNIGISAIKFWKYESGKAEIYSVEWDTQKDVLIKAKDFGLLTLKQEICHAATNKLYKREIFDHVRFREGIVNEDVLFSHDLAKVLVDLNLDMWDLNYYAYYYRIHQDSICRSKVPIIIPYINNLKTIVEEGGDFEYHSVATQLYHHTLYDYYCLLLTDTSSEGKELRKSHLKFLKKQVRSLSYPDTLYSFSPSTLLTQVFFYVAKYIPEIYIGYKNFCSRLSVNS